MKRGSDGEKIMGPMFPRLHVNDTEKGGPRAPPRNKMALYEQLSIPSQRFSHAVMPHNPNNKAASSVSPSSLGGGNDGGMFCARQVHPSYPSEKQYGQHSELSTSLALVEQRKKIDEDDYAVPIFVQTMPTEFDKYSKGFSQEKLSPSNPPYLHSSVKPQLGNEIGMLKISIGQEGGRKKRENSNESVSGRKQISLMSHEPGVNLANSVDRLKTDDSGQPDLCVESQLSHNSRSTAAMGANTAAAARRNSSNSEEALQLGDQNIVHDLSYDSESGEDGGSCRSLHAGNLERGDSVSETSILDTESALEITPDDVVGTIGQKQFWKARRAIMNQQRVFAVQVFELHRLIKVQRLIAASPHLLHEDDACFEKSTKPSQGKKRPLDYAISNAFKAKGDLENPSHKKERSAENTVEKPPFSSAPPSSCMPSAGSGPPASVVSSDHNNNGGASHFNHPMPQGHQWLMPVMSPSEGLVYKPCPAPGFVGHGYGPNPMMDNFLALPVYGVPAPAPQYPFFPPHGPHGYFPHYGMPFMSSAAFSGGSVGQMHASAQESTSTVPSQNNGSGPNQCASEEIIVPGSSSERQRPGPGRRVSNCVEGRNMLPLFPSSSPASNSNSNPRVIKVVPRNGISASESAARIFQSIQEERKQFDSV